MDYDNICSLLKKAPLRLRYKNWLLSGNFKLKKPR